MEAQEHKQHDIIETLSEVKDLYIKSNSTTLRDLAFIISEISRIRQADQIKNNDALNRLLEDLKISNFREDVQFDLIDLDALVVWYQKFLVDQEKHKVDGHNFNIFKLLAEDLNIRIMETMHSKLLKFLLDKNASHGQGALFLNLFLDKLEIYKPEEGEWRVTAEQGRVDILLRRKSPHSVVIIENKSNWAGDQLNQLYRYWFNQIYSKVGKVDECFYWSNKDKYRVIYLAPNKNKRVEEQSLSKPKEWTDSHLPEKMPIEVHTLTFDDFIQDWLDSCENLLKTENRVRYYIAQYKELCKTL